MGYIGSDSTVAIDVKQLEGLLELLSLLWTHFTCHYWVINILAAEIWDYFADIRPWSLKMLLITLAEDESYLSAGGNHSEFIFLFYSYMLTKLYLNKVKIKDSKNGYWTLDKSCFSLWIFCYHLHLIFSYPNLWSKIIMLCCLLFLLSFRIEY